MSSTENPVFFRSFRTPGIGASMTDSGFTPTVLYATTRASGFTPCRSAASSDIATMAAAPSLSWEAFPAVTWPPSRKTGGSLASFSREVSVRIPSSTSTRPAPGTSTGTICSLNRPSCVADAARRWLSRAKRSMSSRVTWNFSATISPVMPIWNWLYASQRPSETIASMNGTLLIPIPQRASFTRYGARLIDSMPPASRTSADPARIMSDANMTVWSPDPHTLFTVTAPTRSGRPPKSAACRAGFWPRPAAITLPMSTSSMSAGTRPDRFTASRERPIQRSIQENRIFEEIGHLECGARHRVEEPDQAIHPAPEDPNGRLARPGGPVDESNEVPRHDRTRTWDVDRPAVRRGRPEEIQHRFGRVVVENEFMERVGIERPST